MTGRSRKPVTITRMTLVAVAAGLLLAGAAQAGEAGPREFRFRKDHVLGTSLDLLVVASDEATAQAAEKAVLDEVERLRLILSTWDEKSEISRLPVGRPVKASAELLEVLGLCQAWRERSGGVFNVQVGDLIALWARAEKDDRLPDESAVQAAAARLLQPAYTLDAAAGTVTRTSDVRLNVDAVTKGYIIDRALAAGRKAAPAVTGLLLDMGGDMRAFGRPSSGDRWVIGVADPRQSAENSPPLARLGLPDGAVCTSGFSLRHFRIGGRIYNHILDPRTGRPASGILGASVVAADAATADALATILCVLSPREGLDLLATVSGAEGLLVDRDGGRHASAGWAAIEAAAGQATVATSESGSAPASSAPPGPAAAASWPEGFQLGVGLALAPQKNRPYVAAWIETPDGRPLRTLAVWGKETKYVKQLTEWYGLMRDRMDAVKAVSRPSRPPGQYALAWDGKDDGGRPMPQGDYVVRVESIREKGPRESLKQAVTCGGEPLTVNVAGATNVSAVVVTYGRIQVTPEK